MTPGATSRLPGTTVRFNNSLEGPRKLTESCYTRVPVDHIGRIHILINQGPTGLGKNSGRIPSWAFQLSFCFSVMHRTKSSWQSCVPTHMEYYQSGKHTWALSVQSFYRGKVKSPSRVWLFAAPWTVAYHDPPSMGFSRQEYWSGLPFPSPEDLPNPGVKPGSPTL